MLYWHHPLWSSGLVPISPAAAVFWEIASEFGVDVVVNGYDHYYERLAPLDAIGQVDRAAGIRPFIVGTGGAWMFEFSEPLPVTEVRDNSTLGVIKFSLYPNSYAWKFISTEREGFSDSGSQACH